MRKVVYIIVILVGSLQILGYLFQFSPLRQIGILTSSSPLPLVFSEVNGVETFASDFYFEFQDSLNNSHLVHITPKIYSKFKGPYNRRNIYGAAIAFGPILPDKLYQPILEYGLCHDILKDELSLPISQEHFQVHIHTRTKGRDDIWKLHAKCRK